MADVIEDVVGATEAHEILGVEPQRIARWRRTGRLPPPYCDLRLSPVWVRADIEKARDGKSDYTPPPVVPPLVGTAEAADMLGCGKSQIARWRLHPTKRGPVFPDPNVRIKAGPLWRREVIAAFKVERAKVLRRQAQRRRARERKTAAKSEAEAA